MRWNTSTSAIKGSVTITEAAMILPHGISNALAPLQTLGDDGIWRVPYDVDQPFTPIALDDLAQVAARVLRIANGTLQLAGADL
mgnify:CR=1 FL=1